jgi:leader peptidase (prepilin peptidase)/N-methyltransferase
VLLLLESYPAAFVAVVFVLGLLVGSFLNVVIHRLPVMLNREWQEQCAELQVGSAAATPLPPPAGRYDLLTPGSACPRCKAPIRALHNIPILSWLWLRGRCANCHAGISMRYPLVELLTAVLSALVAWKFGFSVSAACGLLITWYLVALTMIDVDHQLLPDSLTLPLLWMGLLASVVIGAAPDASLPVNPRDSIIGAVAGYLSLWSVYKLFKLATGKEGMGYGDFKLLAALGAWLGWRMLLPIVLMSAAVGAILGIGVMVVRRSRESLPIPFGPYLAAAGFLAMLWGPEGLAAYLGLYTR